MIAAEDLVLEQIDEVQDIHGVSFPEEPKFRQFLITGPPGSGKSTLVGKMRGWPYEGYVDLSLARWWTIQTLTFRPREIHLGAPFEGHQEALTVLDDEWVDNRHSLRMDFSRILIPPEKTWLFGTDWKARYVFEFVLPPSDVIYRYRVERARTGLFPHDRQISPDIVDCQVGFYRTIAWYFWRSGMHVYIRAEHDGPPMRIIERIRPPSL